MAGKGGRNPKRGKRKPRAETPSLFLAPADGGPRKAWLDRPPLPAPVRPAPLTRAGLRAAAKAGRHVAVLTAAGVVVHGGDERWKRAVRVAKVGNIDAGPWLPVGD